MRYVCRICKVDLTEYIRGDLNTAELIHSNAHRRIHTSTLVKLTETSKYSIEEWVEIVRAEIKALIEIDRELLIVKKEN